MVQLVLSALQAPDVFRYRTDNLVLFICLYWMGNLAFFYLVFTTQLEGTVAAHWFLDRGPAPEIGFAVNSNVFLFMICVYSLTVPLLTKIKQHRNSNNATEVSNSGHDSNPIRLIIVGCMIVLGTIAEISSKLVSKELNQIFYLLTYLVTGAFSYLTLSCSRKNALMQDKQMLIWSVGIYGLLMFGLSGTKGNLFLIIFYLLWLIGCAKPKLMGKMVVAGILFFCLFVILLPRFNYVKQSFGQGKYESVQSTISDLVEADDSVVAQSYSHGGQVSSQDSSWYYFGIRLCVAGMTMRYYNAYNDHPLGVETIEHSIQNILPRAINPDKPDLDSEYNNIARQTGIGGISDTKTSRKPTFIDEVIFSFGLMAPWIGGILFGVYLIIIELIIVLSCRNPNERLMAGLMSLSLGQVPQIGAIVVSAPYRILFICLIVVPILRRLDRNSRSSYNNSSGLYPEA